MLVHFRPRALPCAALVLAALQTSAATCQACATCACGDPTLTSMGAVVPFANRVRAALSAHYRTDSVGRPGVDELRLREARLELSLAYAPTAWFMASVSAPLLWRDVQYASLARDRSAGLGDAELMTKFAVYRDRPFAAERTLALLAGARLPTAPVERDRSGASLPIEAQPGTGAWWGIVGASYAQRSGEWSSYLSALAYLPTAGRAGLEPGFSLRSTLAGQYQPWTFAAFRIGFDARVDGRAFERGVRERDSGGFVGFVSPAVLWSPRADWTLQGMVQVPLINALNGYHREGTYFSLAFMLDL